MNTIVDKQDQEEFLRLLRARKQTYRTARIWQGLQFALTVLIPMIGAVLLIKFSSSLRPLLALYSLAIPVFDVIWLDRWYKQALKKAAKIAEQFDCDLLDLPWDKFTVRDRVDVEDIIAASQAFAKHTNDERLKGWYSTENANAEAHVARLICQRTNLHYDSQLRTLYGRVTAGIGIAIVIVLLAIAWAQNVSLQDFVLTLAPAAPVLGWTVREYYRQRDAFDRARELKAEIEKLFENLEKKKINKAECEAQSRLFQTGIYIWRANTPLGIPYIYELNRNRLEKQMHEWTRALITRFRPKRKG